MVNGREQRAKGIGFKGSGIIRLIRLILSEVLLPKAGDVFWQCMPVLVFVSVLNVFEKFYVKFCAILFITVFLFIEIHVVRMGVE